MNIKNAEIINLLQVDSTNSEAQRLLKKKRISTPLWIVAEKQTSGKGRGEKKWVSSRGNLFASLILPISFNIKNLPILSCAVSLATFECIKCFKKDDHFLKIKWPNDILFKDSKLSGILIENSLSTDLNYSIIGVGINVNSSPSKLDHSTSSLKSIIGEEIDLKPVLAQLSISLDKYLGELESGKLEDLIAEYTSKTWRLNEEVQFSAGKDSYIGTISSINNNFEIEISINNTIKRFNSGELSFKY
tara:strand:+ start:1692 stop:2429 length:738 start_codon:yes stop_codon:yes gene_type:complete